jgi:hypothetical protein
MNATYVGGRAGQSDIDLEVPNAAEKVVRIDIPGQGTWEAISELISVARVSLPKVVLVGSGIQTHHSSLSLI